MASADLKIGRKETLLTNLDVQTQGIDLKGWFKVAPGLKRGAILADLGIMNVGLDVRESGTKIILTKVKSWFEENKNPPAD